ncbi:MAG: hypothetical protein J0I12_07860 [Candidatus Eremiobacteraeota bacterium]|nr:hypothetical protein [Candidatus Eremiobacteraeota bacterium]
MKQTLKDVRKGQTPFENREDFQEKLQQLLQGLPSTASADQKAYLEELKARKDVPARPWWKLL